MQSGVESIGKLRANRRSHIAPTSEVTSERASNWYATIEREYHDIHLVGPAKKLADPARVGGAALGPHGWGALDYGLEAALRLDSAKNSHYVQSCTDAFDYSALSCSVVYKFHLYLQYFSLGCSGITNYGEHGPTVVDST
jgi:hypothetical protein